MAAVYLVVAWFTRGCRVIAFGLELRHSNDLSSLFHLRWRRSRFLSLFKVNPLLSLARSRSAPKAVVRFFKPPHQIVGLGADRHDVACHHPLHRSVMGDARITNPQTVSGHCQLMYRYLFVFADEALRLLRARAARSATIDNKGGGSLWWRGKIAGGMVGNLALRAFERSERIYDAMISRGFQDEDQNPRPRRASPITTSHF